MKRRALLVLVVFVFSGIWFAGCAAPPASRDTEARLQNLENKVASYSGLQARVDALEDAARAKGILEPALSTENLPPLPESEATARGHSDFVVSSVPGQKEVTTPPVPLPPLTTADSVAKQNAPVTQAAPPQTAAQSVAPKETASPFTTAKQENPPAENGASPFSAKSTPQPPVVNAQERQTQTPQPPVTQAEAGAAPQVQPQATPQPPVQTQVQQQPQAQQQTQAPQQAQAAPPQAQPQPQAQAQAQKPTPPQGKSDKSVYESALALYEAGKPAESRKAMAAFLESYPSSAYAPNALYWIGESHYSQSQWDQAILSFKDVVARFPKHAKAADALLKLGMCYEKLKDKDNARFHYEALLEDFPGSRAAALAKPKLAAL